MALEIYVQQELFIEIGYCWEVWGTKEEVGVWRKLVALWIVALWSVPLEEKNIRNGWGSFSNLVSFKVVDGSCIYFWHDVWCGVATLKSYFPELYSIARDKEAFVLGYLDSLGTSIHWNPSFYQGNPRLGAGILTLSLICYTSRKSIQGRQIECCGCQLAIMALIWRTIIDLYSLESLVWYPGEVFGRLRPHLALLFLLGRRLWVDPSRLIILVSEVSPLLTGVA